MLRDFFEPSLVVQSAFLDEVSTGRTRLVVESYGSLVGGGTLFGRALGYFLS